MGTILLVSPALRELKKKHKNAKVTMLTLSLNRELCEILSCIIDEVIYLEIQNPLAFFISFIRIISDNRKRNFDIVIDLEFLTNFSALVTLLVTLFDKPRLTVGFSSPSNWRNSIYNINVSFDHSRHITRIFVKMFCSLTGETFEPSFEPERKILLQKMDTGYTKKLLGQAISDKPAFLICVNINAGDLSLHRRWPKEYFAEVVKELIKHPSVTILLIGSKSDVGYVSEFKRSLPASPRILDVSGKTSIKELIGLFINSKLLITNDGGSLHLAEFIGLPTISFFGPETPFLYGPLDKQHYVFYEDLYCSPCLNIYNSKMSHCKKNTCLKNIKPERVLKVIKAIDEIRNL
jgi:ADP-heptose:LPS heptosyltransferase